MQFRKHRDDQPAYVEIVATSLSDGSRQHVRPNLFKLGDLYTKLPKPLIHNEHRLIRELFT